MIEATDRCYKVVYVLSCRIFLGNNEEKGKPLPGTMYAEEISSSSHFNCGVLLNVAVSIVTVVGSLSQVMAGVA